MMTLHKKKDLFVSFFASESQKNKEKTRGKVVFHFKSDYQASVYLVSSKNNELVTPSVNSYHF